MYNTKVVPRLELIMGGAHPHSFLLLLRLTNLCFLCRGPTARFFRVGRLFGADFPIIGQCEHKNRQICNPEFRNYKNRESLTCQTLADFRRAR